MKSANYNNQMFKQIEELMKEVSSVKADLKETKLKNSEEIRTLKLEHQKEIQRLKKENELLREEIKQKDKKIEILETEVDRLKKIINNDSNNSSNPPSSDNKPNKKIPNNREKSGKKAGGQKGHKPYILAKKDVEENIKCGKFEHKVCTHGKQSNSYKSKYVLDTRVSVVAIEHRFYADENGKYNIPKEFQTDVQYGENLKTLCTTLSTEGYVAIERISNLIKNITSEKLNLSTGTIVNFITEFNRKANATLESIKENILNATQIRTDATGARAENMNCFVRNYSTPKCTLLIASRGKSRKYIEETGILNQYVGTIIHDHETVIYNYGTRHGECNVHVSRYLKGCIENTKHKWAKDMRSFLCCLNEHKKDLILQGMMAIRKEKLERFSKRYDEILENGFKENEKLRSKYYKADEKRLLNRLKKYKENHLLFINDFSVPFDNNLSERDLRHVKSKVKISGCFRSLQGLQNYLNVKSIIETCKKKSLNFYEIILNLFKKIPVSI